MSNLGPAVVSWLLLNAIGCLAQAATKPYAQVLIDQTMLRDPGLAMLSISIPDGARTGSTVIASTDRSAIGRQAGDEERQVFAGGPPRTAPDLENQRCQALVPLRDVSGTTVGALRAGFRKSPGDGSGCVRRAEVLGDALRQVIPSGQTLLDPFLIASSPADPLAQRLVMETVASHPDLLVLAFHLTRPGDITNRVVGINQPKFLGRPSDDVDHEVAKTGKMIVQMIPSTHRMETHMPLRAADGALVGAVVTVYLWREESQAPELVRRSMEIRDQLEPRIPGLAALLDPAP